MRINIQSRLKLNIRQFKTEISIIREELKLIKGNEKYGDKTEMFKKHENTKLSQGLNLPQAGDRSI